MRWCYKTVHYEMKKEGILGSVFLDEAEVEQSLNEYGLAGWELVSVMETQDGLIAFFKQSLDAIPRKKTAAEIEEFEVDEIITEEDIIGEDVSEENVVERSVVDDDVMSIRIE